MDPLIDFKNRLTQLRNDADKALVTALKNEAAFTSRAIYYKYLERLDTRIEVFNDIICEIIIVEQNQGSIAPAYADELLAAVNELKTLPGEVFLKLLLN